MLKRKLAITNRRKISEYRRSFEYEGLVIFSIFSLSTAADDRKGFLHPALISGLELDRRTGFRARPLPSANIERKNLEFRNLFFFFNSFTYDLKGTGR